MGYFIAALIFTGLVIWQIRTYKKAIKSNNACGGCSGCGGQESCSSPLQIKLDDGALRGK